MQEEEEASRASRATWRSSGRGQKILVNVGRGSCVDEAAL